LHSDPLGSRRRADGKTRPSTWRAHRRRTPEDLWDDDAKIRQTGYLTDLLGSRAVDVVDTYARSDRPFLISLHFNAPHWPWEAPGDEAEAQRLTNLFHYDGGTQLTYQRMIQQMDLQIDRVMQALDTTVVAENTIVIFTSDNGGERYVDTARSPT
jgi:arylsulfatase A-like enzyme